VLVVEIEMIVTFLRQPKQAAVSAEALEGGDIPLARRPRDCCEATALFDVLERLWTWRHRPAP
jgi:hypothetical protein